MCELYILWKYPNIGFTEYTGIYNVRTGFVDKQDGELTAKMCGSPQYSKYNCV